MDVGGLVHSLKLAVAIHHAARFKRRAARHSITRFGPFGPAGRAEPELLPEAVPVALETGGLLFPAEFAILHNGNHRAVDLDDGQGRRATRCRGFHIEFLGLFSYLPGHLVDHRCRESNPVMFLEGLHCGSRASFRTEVHKPSLE